MAVNFSEKQLKEYCQRTGIPYPAGQERPAGEESKRSKYGNLPAEADGKKFQSRHEAKIYEQLRLECIAGEHLGLGCQAAFYLPGGVKYVADFVTLEADGTYMVYDAKSEATRKDKTYRLKKKQMKNCLGIDIREV